jgi:chitin disaccharide deacetylase
MREISVTIDDGGLHPGVNAAAGKCAEFGTVDRISILATSEGFAEAIMTAMTNQIRVAAHLDCSGGPFLLEGSDFPDSFAGWLSSAPSLAPLAEKEWAAQIEKILSAGGVITALDSHRHLHHIPALQDVIIRLAGEYGIRTVRSAVLPDRMMRFPAGLRLNSLGGQLREKIRSANLVTTDRMLGFGKAGKVDRRYLSRFSDRCSEGTTELVMHPSTEPVWSRGQPGELDLMLSQWFKDWCRGKHQS